MRSNELLAVSALICVVGHERAGLTIGPPTDARGGQRFGIVFTGDTGPIVTLGSNWRLLIART